MKLVVFGLTISSSWGNGHATLWRGLFRALAERGHSLLFFEKDVPYYREHRDLWELPHGELVLYDDWSQVRARAAAELRGADVGMVTSYCPDGALASDLLLGSRCQLTAFYDLDTPITLAGLDAGTRPPWLGRRDLSGFDLVLSFTGGDALRLLRERLGASRVAALYGHVDPNLHRPVLPSERYRGALSYLATYAADREGATEELFFTPASLLPGRQFVLGGSLYPNAERFPGNVRHVEHVAPAEHAAFFCSSPLTLNVTRSTMARLGHCPSGRLFEAAACGVAIVSDWFAGLDHFFDPRSEIVVAHTRDDVLGALALGDAELRRIARRARERTLDEHTARQRALELESLLDGAQSSLVERAPRREALEA